VVWHELRFGAARLPESEKRHAIEAYLEEVVRRVLPILPYWPTVRSLRSRT
jgi:hypothetical protein